MKKYFAYSLFLISSLFLNACIGPPYDSPKVMNDLARSNIVSRTINFEDKNFHYVFLKNENSKNLIVFVHGSPGDWAAYGEYLKDSDLQQNANLIAVDRLGFGKSNPHNPERSLLKHADAIAFAIKEHKVENIIVVGHSYGGPVAAQLTMDYPELIDGLIMLAPSISPSLEENRWYNTAASWRLVRWFLPKSLDTSNQEILPLKQELIKIKSKWSELKIPVTIIQGEEDELVPAANASFAENKLTSTQPTIHLLPNQGHFIVWEQFDLVKQSILEMMSEIGK